MKKTLLIVIAFLGLSLAAVAQPRAIGARVGYGGEFSYQHSFGSNFGELDLGWYAHSFDVVGIYDFVLGGNGLCNFYLGPGAYLGFYNGPHYENHNGMNAGIAGQIGVEWNIPQIPLQISIDWRPVYLFAYEDGPFRYESVGLGIRYRF